MRDPRSTLFAARAAISSLMFAALFLSAGCGTTEAPAAAGAGAVDGGAVDGGALDGGAGDIGAGDVDGADAGASDAGAADAGAVDASACTPVARSTAPTTLKGNRPASVFLPDSWDGCKQWPLIVLLHGYGASGVIQNIYLGIGERVTSHGFVLVLPEGTKSKSGKQFWDATNACCNFEDGPVDDVAYLRGLIETATKQLAIDPERVFLIGHSNGGFMAYRMACEAADLVAGVASLAGAVTGAAASCKPTRAVNVLQMHGTDDATINYNGTVAYPGAEAAETRWIGLNGCTAASVALPAVDFDGKPAGKETVQRNATDCDEGTQVGLWKMTGSGHIPAVNAAFKDALLAHVLAWKRTLKP